MLISTYSILQFSAILNAISYLILFFFLLFKKSKNAVSWTLLGLYFFAEIWALGYFFPFTSSSESLSLLSFQLLHVGAVFLTAAHFHFICAFLGITHLKRKAIFMGYALNALILPFVFTEWFISGMSPRGSLTYFFDPGMLYHFWLALWFFYFTYAALLELHHYKQTSGIKRVQLKYLLIANVIGFLSGSTNFLVAYEIQIIPYFNIFASIHGLFLIYIILRYRFLDVKVTFSNWAKNFLAYFFAALFAFFASYLLEGLDEPVQFVVVSMLFLFSYLKIRSYFDSSHFYKLFQLTNTVHLKNVVSDFIAQNHFYENLDQLQGDLNKIFCEQFKISSVQILLSNPEKKVHPNLHEYFTKNRTFLVTKEVGFRNETQKHTAPFYNELTSLGELCFPLYKRDKTLIGFLVFGKKPFDEIYTDLELEILQGAAHYVTLLLSAILYNVDLQREIKAKTQKLLEQNKEIKKLYELERETSAILSHELKTPIVLLSNTHWFLEKYLQDHESPLGKNFAPLYKFSEEIKEATQRMNTISNSIFHLREVEYQLSLKLQKLNWPEQLGQLLHHMANLAELKGIRFSSQFDLKEGHFYAASAQFEQVLTILLDNAMKYTTQGEVKLRVFQEENTLFAEVEDTGPGIRKSLRKDLFKRFFRGSHDFKVEGLGLGLYMAKKIMDQIEGSILLKEKREGTGTIFRLELPLHKALTKNRKLS